MRTAVEIIYNPTIHFNKKWQGSKTLEQRFWGKVEVKSDEECWNWTGCVSKIGYGSFKYGKTNRIAHRVSYAIKHGKTPADFECCHKCDNRKCVNPNHLFLATHQENMKDMKQKGRCPKNIGENHPHAVLNNEKVLEIRGLYQSGHRIFRLGIKFGVTPQNILRIVQRKTWIHI